MKGSVRKKTVIGDSVILRPVTKADLDLLASWFADQAFVVWWGGRPKARAEVATKYLNDRDERYAFIIELDGLPIGYIQAWADRPPDGGIDIALKPDAQGKGFGTDATRTLALHLRAVGWQRITVDPAVKNYRALRAFEKAGFVRDHVDGDHLILFFES